MSLQRVVITGIGAITPLGLNIADTWTALLAAKSGMAEITRFDPSALPTRYAAEVKGFDPVTVMNVKDVRRTDLHQQFGMAAARQALDQSGLKAAPDNMADMGVVMGTGAGGHRTLLAENVLFQDKGTRRVNPFIIPMVMNNGLVGLLAMEFGFGGPSYCPSSACSTGNDSIGQAFNLIRWGQAKAILAGGADSTVSGIGMAGFAQAGALSTHVARAPRPFDLQRDGILIGEGAGCLVLESLDFARARGANILAEVIGYGMSNDAYHMVAPSPGGEGAARAVELALKDARLVPEDIDYINAHGTGTRLNDAIETQAIKRVFRDYARTIPISSTKSMTGHCMGAAGAIEAALCVLMLCNNIVLPTINLTEPDPECDLDYVPGVARAQTVRVAMNNSFGFGGHNSVLLFKKFEA